MCVRLPGHAGFNIAVMYMHGYVCQYMCACIDICMLVRVGNIASLCGPAILIVRVCVVVCVVCVWHVCVCVWVCR